MLQYPTKFLYISIVHATRRALEMGVCGIDIIERNHYLITCLSPSVLSIIAIDRDLFKRDSQFLVGRSGPP